MRTHRHSQSAPYVHCVGCKTNQVVKVSAKNTTAGSTGHGAECTGHKHSLELPDVTDMLGKGRADCSITGQALVRRSRNAWCFYPYVSQSGLPEISQPGRGHVCVCVTQPGRRLSMESE